MAYDFKVLLNPQLGDLGYHFILRFFPFAVLGLNFYHGTSELCNTISYGSSLSLEFHKIAQFPLGL
jgi:hypothetical protein